MALFRPYYLRTLNAEDIARILAQNSERRFPGRSVASIAQIGVKRIVHLFDKDCTKFIQESAV
jgi:hypothetical protein